MYHTLLKTPYGKMTKKTAITHKRAKRSTLSQQVITRLQGQTSQYDKDKHETYITRRIHKRSSALEWTVNTLTGGLKHV